MCKRMVATALAIAVLGSNGLAFAQQCPATVPAQGAPIAAPLPVFPSDNWWNTDISAAPVDAKSASFISFIGTTRTLHPDFGGEESPGSTAIYGFPYAVVDASQPKQAVSFLYWDESDGVDMNSGNGIPFYPIPSQAISQAHWVESGSPASVDERDINDRHLLMIDCTKRTLYELYNVWYSNAEHRWYAGSGAFYDMTRNDRRPEGWTSADAAGLAIFPGLVRYDEAGNSAVAEINHAFRVTVRTSNGHVYPASHTAGSTAGALPMGARLRLKKLVNGIDPATRTTDPTARKIFRAMQKYGLIVADNGSDMYISGTFDVRWNNGTLNPAFSALSASDFEVVQLGWKPAVAPPQLFVDDASIKEGTAGTKTLAFTVRLSATATSNVTVAIATSNLTATAGSDYVAAAGSLTFSPGQTARTFPVTINGDSAREASETFQVTLSNPANATLGDAQAIGTIINDDLRTGGLQPPTPMAVPPSAFAVPTPVMTPRKPAVKPASRFRAIGAKNGGEHW